MNCLEYRHALLVNPTEQSDDMLEHKQSCEVCAAFTREQKAMESDLHTALEVPIPDGLASRVLLRHSVEQKQAPAWRQWPTLAMAASVLFATVLIVQLQFNTELINEQAIEQVALKHVYDEEKHLQDRNNVSLAELNKMLQVASLKLNQQPSTVNYAGQCDIRRDQGVHMVMDGEKGPVTVLFMPKEYVTEPLSLADGRFDVRVIPIKGGSLAIIGEKGEPIEKIESQLRQNIVYI